MHSMDTKVRKRFYLFPLSQLPPSPPSFHFTFSFPVRTSWMAPYPQLHLPVYPNPLNVFYTEFVYAHRVRRTLRPIHSVFISANSPLSYVPLLHYVPCYFCTNAITELLYLLTHLKHVQQWRTKIIMPLQGQRCCLCLYVCIVFSCLFYLCAVFWFVLSLCVCVYSLFYFDPSCNISFQLFLLGISFACYVCVCVYCFVLF